jgi:hypothetical protein
MDRVAVLHTVSFLGDRFKAWNDVIVLAQASMANLTGGLQSTLQAPVLASAPLCMEVFVRYSGKA